MNIAGKKINISLPHGRETSRVTTFLIKILRKNPLFTFLFIVPFGLSLLYFGFIESDVYTSECVFVVRQPDRKSLSSLGALLQNIGISSVREEAFTVRDYVLSRDALKTIDENLKLRNIYGSSSIDFFNRFNPLRIDDSFEALYEYYLKKVTVNVDLTSSIAKLQVHAYSKNAAYNIAEGLLFMSEGLINKLNARAKKDMEELAMREVKLAEEETKERSVKLSLYQDKEILFDPAQQSTMQLQHVARLQSELISIRGHIAQLREFAPESPQIRGLEKRAQELQREINSEMSKVVGGDESMTQKLIEYERLRLDRELAAQRLTSALASLEQARTEVQRQQLYLERIVAPHVPDSPMLPRRMHNILGSFGVLLMLYGVVRMLLIGILEHRD